jgi:hypothetical protein
MPIDYRKYPKNWLSKIVPAILMRDNNTCQHCGLKDRELVWSVPYRSMKGTKHVRVWVWQNYAIIPNTVGSKLVRVILTVAHLDHDATNHAVELKRLLSLCQRCHLKYDAGYKSSKKKSRFHTKTLWVGKNSNET